MNNSLTYLRFYIHKNSNNNNFALNYKENVKWCEVVTTIKYFKYIITALLANEIYDPH